MDYSLFSMSVSFINEKEPQSIRISICSSDHEYNQNKVNKNNKKIEIELNSSSYILPYSHQITKTIVNTIQIKKSYQQTTLQII